MNINNALHICRIVLQISVALVITILVTNSIEHFPRVLLVARQNNYNYHESILFKRAFLQREVETQLRNADWML